MTESSTASKMKKWKMKRQLLAKHEAPGEDTYTCAIAGYLEKRGKLLAGWQKRWFEAGEGSLRYFADASKTSCLAQIDLTMVDIEHVESTVFFSLTTNGSKMQLRAEEEEQAVQWVQLLKSIQNDADEDAILNVKSGSSIDSSTGPEAGEKKRSIVSGQISGTGALFQLSSNKQSVSTFNCLKLNIQKANSSKLAYMESAKSSATRKKVVQAVTEVLWEHVHNRAVWNAYHILDSQLPPVSMEDLRRHIAGFAGLSSEKSHFSVPPASTSCVKLHAYKSPIPCILLVLEALLKIQGGLYTSDVFTANTPDMNAYLEEKELLDQARSAIDGGTFLRKRWPNRTLANLLKCWFRFLPRQLLSVCSVETLTDSTAASDPKAAGKVLNAMPEPEQSIFKWLLHFLGKLVDYQERNGMTRSEAACIFLPQCLNIVYFRIDIHGTDHAVGVGLSSTKKALRFFKAMIQHQKRWDDEKISSIQSEEPECTLSGKIRV